MEAEDSPKSASAGRASAGAPNAADGFVDGVRGTTGPAAGRASCTTCTISGGNSSSNRPGAEGGTAIADEDRGGGKAFAGAAGASSASTPSVLVVPGELAGTASVSLLTSDEVDGVESLVVSVAPDGISVTADGRVAQVTNLTAGILHTFAVNAQLTNGNSIALVTHPIGFYDVVETFEEPACDFDTVFTGTYALDTGSGIVSGLSGTLTEAMYEGPPTVALDHQMASQPVSLGGIDGQLVTAFALPTTETFVGGAWLPGAAVRTLGNGNAYAMIFVDPNAPLRVLEAAQVDWLSYADCTEGGLMGRTCMTGTTVAAYGRIGTMKGYPVAQVTRQR